MPTHTAADTAYIERLPSAVIAAFRNDQFEPAHCAANAVDFLEDNWINIKHLKAFVGDKGAELLASLADSTRPVSDADYIRRVPHGILTSFRNTGRRPGFLIDNASDFLGTEWVKPALLRRFTEDWKRGGGMSLGNNSGSVAVKQEETVAPLASVPTALRVRTSKDEIGREILELLSDSEVSDAEMADITEPRTSSPAPSLMSLLIPDTTSLFTPSSEPSPVEDNPATYLPSPNTNLPPTSHMLPPIPDLARLLELDSNGQPLYLQLPISDTLWADDIVSYVLIGRFQVTSKETVERVEYLRELPSLWPIPKVRTAFVLDLRDPKFEIRDPKYETHEKSGDDDDDDVLLTVDALVKDADNDPWRGNTGVSDSKSHVQLSPGGPRPECRRARLTCPGCHACEHVPENLIRVERRDLSTEQREAIFKAQTEARRLQGTTPERRVAEFVAVVRKHRCPAAAVDGRPCDGAPIPIRLAQPFQGHTFAIGCSSSPPSASPQASGHRLINIPFNVDEKMALKAIAGQPVASDASKDTPACSGIVPPTTGGRRKTCAGEHIKNGIAAPSARIKHYPCRAKRTIFVPLDGLRIGVVLHGEFGHDHVLPPITHPSHLLKARFFDLLDIVGVVGATVQSLDDSAVVRHVLGGKTLAQVAPAFQSIHLRQRLIRERKHQMFPHGLGLEGARHLFLEDQALPPNERYVHRFVELDDGKVIILTCDPRLLRLLDDPGVTSFEADTTYKRTNGEIDELEIVTYVSAYASAVTIGRVYVNGRSAAYFERVFDELVAVKLELTGKPIAFKIFGEGGNLLAFNSDMDSAQVLGFTRAMRKQVNFDLAPQLRDLTAEQLAPRLVKLCLTHAKRALLDFRGEFPPRHPDYGALFEIFYIDSLEKLNAYSALIRRLGKPRIQAWWDHKNLSDTPATTNTGEGQHHRTNKRTGTKLPVVEAMISGRIVDHSTGDQLVHTDVIHQLPNPRNESSHRFARKLGRQQTALHQTQAAHAEEENRARLDAEIAAGGGVRVKPYGSNLDPKQLLLDYNGLGAELDGSRICRTSLGTYSAGQGQHISLHEPEPLAEARWPQIVRQRCTCPRMYRRFSSSHSLPTRSLLLLNIIPRASSLNKLTAKSHVALQLMQFLMSFMTKPSTTWRSTAFPPFASVGLPPRPPMHTHIGSQVLADGRKRLASNEADELDDLYDPFEPMFVAAALEREPNLGALIFGSADLERAGTLDTARLAIVVEGPPKKKRKSADLHMATGTLL
ncbi:hypothetical protein HMN09_00861500 [Mycena chlorophos]|uniref:Uncharacterized protein n=1 Tax=Mycena chlorophos TaxID=658473 RepID=A0A8H6W9X1_MYCCL|nr:hypothetical protein HMN09_00861500 [Mycena chlorophos]